jgi:membrane-bound serine protease (ClpP class)
MDACGPVVGWLGRLSGGQRGFFLLRTYNKQSNYGYNECIRFCQEGSMEILLNPNTAYVLLIVGAVLMLLAILTPGTGALEVGAFFFLALTAYVIYRVGLNPWALVVLVASVVPFIYATRQPRRKIWLATGILGVLLGSIYLFNAEGGWLPAVNPLLALVVSALAGGFLWIAASKTLQAQQAPPRHDLQALVGQLGEAKTDIRESGSVQVAGELWSARSEKTIPAGATVRVIGREGFVLIVEKVKP